MNVKTYWQSVRNTTDAGVKNGSIPQIRQQFASAMLEKIERLEKRGEPIGEMRFADNSSNEILRNELARAEIEKARALRENLSSGSEDSDDLEFEDLDLEALDAPPETEDFESENLEDFESDEDIDLEN